VLILLCLCDAFSVEKRQARSQAKLHRTEAKFKPCSRNELNNCDLCVNAQSGLIWHSECVWNINSNECKSRNARTRTWALGWRDDGECGGVRQISEEDGEAARVKADSLTGTFSDWLCNDASNFPDAINDKVKVAVLNRQKTGDPSCYTGIGLGVGMTFANTVKGTTQPDEFARAMRNLGSKLVDGCHVAVCNSFAAAAYFALVGKAGKAIDPAPRIEFVQTGNHAFLVVNRAGGAVSAGDALPARADWGAGCFIVDAWAESIGWPLVTSASEREWGFHRAPTLVADIQGDE